MRKQDLHQLEPWLWEIPATYRADMRVPARVYTNERMLESMTFPGVLNWLQCAQPRHFQGGGRATSTKTIEYDRLYQPPARKGGSGAAILVCPGGGYGGLGRHAI